MRNIKLTIEYDGKDFNRMAKTGIIVGFEHILSLFQNTSNPIY